MRPEALGQELVAKLKAHILEVLTQLPECSPNGQGLGNAEIERRAGLALHLDKQDHWLCWSILKVLEREGQVGSVGSPSRWRLRAKRNFSSAEKNG
jgi:hypothetical protein